MDFVYPFIITFLSIRVLRRVLRYLKGTQEVGVKISPQNNILEMYADADWARGSDRISVSWYILQLGGCTVGWKSVKQKIVSGSSTESEYISLSDASKETLWAKNFMNEIGETQENGGTLIHQDTSGSIAWAKGNGQWKRTKHIDVRYHEVQQLISFGAVGIQYTQTNSMKADLMTKPLFNSKLHTGMTQISLCNPKISNQIGY